MKQILLPESFKEWKIIAEIGEGSYGNVYKAVNINLPEDDENRFAAIKIIKIPGNDTEKKNLEKEFPDTQSQISYYKNLMQELLGEIRVMESLKGHCNVVRLDDFYVDEDLDKMEWKLFIRMEYLEPLTDYSILHVMNEQDVLKMGINLCDALIACDEKKIIHRDIKPENIFVSGDGTFKIGDFGIARRIHASVKTMSLKGSLYFMAPEVYHGEQYDARADQYSLGLVLYRFLNKNRDPFVDLDKKIVYHKEKEEAFFKRMKGNEIPEAVEASENLKKILKKTCAYDPNDRFADALELRTALQRAYDGKTLHIKNRKHRPIPEKKGGAFWTLTGLAILLVIGLAIFLMAGSLWKSKYLTETSEKMNENVNESVNEVINEGTDGSRDESESENRNTEQNALLKSLKDTAALYDGHNLTEYAFEADPSLVSENAEDKKELGELIDQLDQENQSDGLDGLKTNIIYLDDEFCLAETIHFAMTTDEVADTSNLQENYYQYAFRKSGSWKEIELDEISDEVYEKINQSYLPEDLLKARDEGNNCTWYNGIFWRGKKAFLDDEFSTSVLAAWQNSDGSLDVLLSYRNGNLQEKTDSALFLALTDGDKTVLAAKEQYNVTVKAESTSGRIAHFEAEDVQTGEEAWEALRATYSTDNNDNNLFD